MEFPRLLKCMPAEGQRHLLRDLVKEAENLGISLRGLHLLPVVEAIVFVTMTLQAHADNITEPDHVDHTTTGIVEGQFDDAE